MIKAVLAHGVILVRGALAFVLSTEDNIRGRASRDERMLDPGLAMAVLRRIEAVRIADRSGWI